MIKAKSKSKIKHSIALPKKNQDISHKNTSRRNQDKENGGASLRITQAICSKKHNKTHHESNSQTKSKNKSTNNFGNSIKNNQSKKLDDEKFIDKLFSKTQKLTQKQPCFVQQLIQQIVPSNVKKNVTQNHNHKFKNLELEILQKNRQVNILSQQLQQLKLYVSNFTFKVFDLTILCKRILNQTFSNYDRKVLAEKVTEIVSYIDSLVRQWNLEQKIKIHTESTLRKCREEKNNVQIKKRCHTQSLKIPLEDYLQNLKDQQSSKNSYSRNSIRIQATQQLQKTSINTMFQNRQELNQQKNIAFSLDIPHNLSQRVQQVEKEDQSEQIMKIVSRRNSEIRKDDQQIYVVLRPYQTKNAHELNLKSGDRISVLDKSNTQKWVGLKDGIIGYFPKDILF